MWKVAKRNAKATKTKNCSKEMKPTGTRTWAKKKGEKDTKRKKKKSEERAETEGFYDASAWRCLSVPKLPSIQTVHLTQNSSRECQRKWPSDKIAKANNNKQWEKLVQKKGKLSLPLTGEKSDAAHGSCAQATSAAALDAAFARRFCSCAHRGQSAGLSAKW